MDRDADRAAPPADLSPDALADLGLGPDAPLLNDPKLFVDGRFLAALLAELEIELGAAASAALFQIGAIHGVRDARRLVTSAATAEDLEDAAPIAAAPPLAMQLVPVVDGRVGLGFEGEWPDAHEAAARLARVGRAPRPACALSAGYTSGWLSEVHDRDLLAVEQQCAATGAAACRFLVAEREVWLEAPGATAAGLPRVDREVAPAAPRAPRPAETAAPGEAAPQLDPADEAVHVWGPVMVLPFTRPEDALATLHVLGRDRTTASVRAVVVDLRQQPLDPGYGAEILAQALEAIESWGAEAVLTGVCDLSAPLVAELGGIPLLTRKDLPDAVASAFQIAEAQRHPL